MKKFVSILGISASVLLAGALTSAADDACYSVAGDDAAVATVWEELSDACPCSDARSDKWKTERNSYLRCARNFVQTSVARGSLRKPCKKDVLKGARDSVCARPASSVTCCLTGKVGTACEVVPDASDCRHQYDKWRFAELGSSETCMDACDQVEGPECLAHSDCDDGNPCTWDTCDLLNGCWNVDNGSCSPQPTPGGTGGTSCSGKGSATHGYSAKEIELKNLINDYRRSKGKGELRLCTSLSVAAQDHANDQRDRNYYSHTGANGSTFYERMCDAGFQPGCGPATYVGEIIMRGVTTPAAAMQAWMGSPGHDAHLRTGGYVVMGIGHSCGGPKDYWVVEFSSRNDSSCN